MSAGATSAEVVQVAVPAGFTCCAEQPVIRFGVPLVKLTNPLGMVGVNATPASCAGMVTGEPTGAEFGDADKFSVELSGLTVWVMVPEAATVKFGSLVLLPGELL